jgi:hypothetical protein
VICPRRQLQWVLCLGAPAALVTAVSVSGCLPRFQEADVDGGLDSSADSTLADAQFDGLPSDAGLDANVSSDHEAGPDGGVDRLAEGALGDVQFDGPATDVSLDVTVRDEDEQLADMTLRDERSDASDTGDDDISDEASDAPIDQAAVTNLGGDVEAGTSWVIPAHPAWQPVVGCASAIGSGWAVGCGTPLDLPVLQWQPASQMLVAANPAAAAASVSVDLNGNPWLVRGNGTIWKWNGSAFAAFHSETRFCASSVASGSNDAETWAIGCGTMAQVYHWDGSGAWVLPDGAATAQKIAIFSTPDPATGAHLPVVLGSAGTGIYFYQGSTRLFSDHNGDGNDVTTDFAVGTDGAIWHWNAGWTSYIAAPWGASTKIGAWANGVFAMDSGSGKIMQICTNNGSGGCL